MNKDEIFNRLVENGLDFLLEAISELQEKPKYSVIHFSAAVELLLKARLMNEHWSLVITKRQEADWNKFVAGDFQSVTLDEAANRLKKIVRSELTTAELEAFKEVAKHRNKMVHFFHEEHTEEESDLFKQKIVKEQLKAWYFLHQLLTVKWSNKFFSWHEKIEALDSDLRELHEFLQIVFDNLKPKIDALKEEGVRFEKCPSCDFESQKHGEIKNILYESKCLVCGLIEKCLNIECPGCRKVVTFKEEGFSVCSSCNKDFEPENLVDVLSEFSYTEIDNDESWNIGNCSDCDGYHTVVRIKNDEWVCASCFGEFESLEYCGWCNDLNTGDMGHSSWAGCNYCDGNAG